MQDIIEGLIQGIGYLALRLVTFGRYKSSRDGRLAEGAIGLGLIALAGYVMYALRP